MTNVGTLDGRFGRSLQERGGWFVQVSAVIHTTLDIQGLSELSATIFALNPQTFDLLFKKFKKTIL